MARIDWKSIVGAVAPTIATALGGPLAGMAVSAISQAVLDKPSASEDEIGQAIMNSNNPELLLKLKQAEAAFARHMKQLDIDLERLAAEDREGARQREISLRDWMPKALALLYTVAYFVVLALLWKYPVDISAKEIISTLFGILSAAQMAIIGYYFGSTAGSSKKSDIIESLSSRK